MSERTIIEHIASAISAYHNCKEKNNIEMMETWKMRLSHITNVYLPHGSGIDNGCTIEIERSTHDRIIISTAFHHMNEHGFYDGWTNHDITLRPSFIHEMKISVSGRDRNDIKDYLADLFLNALSVKVSDRRLFCHDCDGNGCNNCREGGEG